MTAKKWIVSFFALVLAIVLLLSAAAWAVDPFFQFRSRDNAYMLSAIFSGSGLIRTWDYDTLILGSSMIQNFDMDRFRDKLGAKPLHVGLGALRASELLELTELGYEAGKAETYYICADLWAFTNTKESRIPQHLLRRDLLSRLRYLLSYEVWFRYIPVDTGLLLADRLGVSLPYKFAYSRSIDRLDDWQLDYPPSSFGREAAFKNYRIEAARESDVEKEGLYGRMTENIDAFLGRMDLTKGKHVFFFPPYSSLYWCDAQDRGVFADYLRAKRYFIEQAEKLGAEVYDFQSEDFTADPDNYKDTTHFLPQYNDWMVDRFADGGCRVTAETAGAFEARLIELTERCREENASLFETPPTP